MPTALTGSLGWTGLHPVQLGGPPLISTWSRSLPSQAVPLVAHAYQNDGVTPLGTFSILNRPSIKATTANGGYDQITLEVAAPRVGALYGQAIFGLSTYGGLTQGNVMRLTEADSPFKGFVYGGVIESFPDTRSATGTKHQIVVTPFGAELTRVATQLVYTAPTDIAQAVRNAVALTQHCSCDQVSVPPSTGIMLAQSGAVDFRGQKVNQVLDTCRSIAGPTWFWYCDELGRVWFQQQGSAAVYTLMGGQHYEERVTNGGDIQDRINQVPAVGGVPTGGSANVQATANGSSQSTIGIRTLDPPIQAPGITDQATLTALANGILATLDQTWTRFTAKVLPPLGVANEKHPGRIHGSQPGGAMVRYWEPAVNPLPESAAGAGYVGPFVLQSHEYDGLHQQIEAGSIPVTSQTDIQNMVESWAQRAAANALQVTAAALNLQQTLTGSFQSGTGTMVNGQRATLWSLGQQEFAAIDPNAITRAEMGNLPARGISPAQWGFRASDANGNPIFDSLGLISVMNLLGSAIEPGTFSVTSSTPTLITGTAVTFTLTRASSVLIAYGASMSVPSTGALANNLVDLFIDNVNESSAGGGPALELQFCITSQGALTSSFLYTTTLAAGSHTVDLRASRNGTNTPTVLQGIVYVFQAGS